MAPKLAKVYKPISSTKRTKSHVKDWICCTLATFVSWLVSLLLQCWNSTVVSAFELGRKAARNDGVFHSCVSCRQRVVKDIESIYEVEPPKAKEKLPPRLCEKPTKKQTYFLTAADQLNVKKSFRLQTETKSKLNYDYVSHKEHETFRGKSEALSEADDGKKVSGTKGDKPSKESNNGHSFPRSQCSNAGQSNKGHCGNGGGDDRRPPNKGAVTKGHYVDQVDQPMKSPKEATTGIQQSRSSNYGGQNPVSFPENQSSNELSNKGYSRDRGDHIDKIGQPLQPLNLESTTGYGLQKVGCEGTLVAQKLTSSRCSTMDTGSSMLASDAPYELCGRDVQQSSVNRDNMSPAKSRPAHLLLGEQHEETSFGPPPEAMKTPPMETRRASCTDTAKRPTVSVRVMQHGDNGGQMADNIRAVRRNPVATPIAPRTIEEIVSPLNKEKLGVTPDGNFQENIHYECLRRAGRGAFAECYYCRNKYTGKEFVKKQLKAPNKMKTHEISEIRVWNHLNNKSEFIVHFYGATMHNGIINMFIEAMSGSFQDLDDKHHILPLPEKEVYAMVKPILRGLEFIHGLGIGHRDLSCRNVLYNENSMEVKIADFGLSVFLNEGDHSETKGTPQYMSPEVCRGEPFCRSSDMWAVGCIKLQLLTGHIPWSKYNCNIQIIYAVGMGCVPEIPETCSNDMKKSLGMMLQADNGKRRTAKAILRLRSYCNKQDASEGVEPELQLVFQRILEAKFAQAEFAQAEFNARHSIIPANNGVLLALNDHDEASGATSILPQALDDSTVLQDLQNVNCIASV